MTELPDRGRVLAGKYELVDVAGEGGMAVVWRANMRGAAGFVRPVAVKKLRPELRTAKDYVSMFVEEARVGSELSHPNIVQTLDFVEDGDRGLCLVTEWVEGLDLGTFIKTFRARHERMPWAMAVAIGVGALRGLAAAHERVTAYGEPAPVIHRDVSPQNILLGANGVVKLTDFGLARARDRLYSLTAPGIVKGKLSYLAPEITKGDPATVASDLFAMASVLWEALTSHALFDASSDREVFRKIYRGEIESIAQRRPGLPVPLVAAIHRALDIDPGRRFSSAREMAQELAAVLAGALPPGKDAQSLLGHAVAEARTQLGR